MTDCESARAELGRNQDWESRASSDVAGCERAVSAAGSDVARAQQEWDAAVRAATGADGVVSERAAAVRAAEAELAEAERSYEGSNRDAYLGALRDAVRQAGYSLSDAERQAGALTERATGAARDHDSALRAETTCSNELDVAERDLAAARSAVAAAQRVVSEVCG